jgi:thymidylate synthase
MQVVKSRNVNAAFIKLMRSIKSVGVRRLSRAGGCIEMPTPVTTIYENPMERVLFSPERDANPFFHLMEALWMLAGRNDMGFITHYNRRMKEFSDDGGLTQHGAYGHRWRVHFGGDQLNYVVDLLTNKPWSRRAVIQIYDCHNDLDPNEDRLKDVPCNVMVHVQLRPSEGDTGEGGVPYLDMEVFCRSNDLIWGTTGANAVHFSILQEYLAARLGVEIGVLYQISCNLHAYDKTYQPLLDKGILNKVYEEPYVVHDIKPDRIVTHPESFDEELISFIHGCGFEEEWQNDFFPNVAIPMREAYKAFRNGEGLMKYSNAGEYLKAAEGPIESDWLRASFEWIDRREQVFKNKMKEEKSDG